VALLDQLPFAKRVRRVVMDGALDELMDILQVVPSIVHGLEQTGGAWRNEVPEVRQHNEGLAQGDKVPGIGRAKGDAADEPLQVVHPSEVGPEARAHLVALLELRYGGKPRVDLLNVQQAGSASIRAAACPPWR